MPQTTKALPPASLEYTKMLFLVSHGLQTPLSAIRWGCGRLHRKGENLTEEQKKLLEGIMQESRILAALFDWLLLLAKVEDGVYVPNIQDVFVHDFLITSLAEVDVLRGAAMPVSCPKELKIRVDRTLFESILHALFLTVVVSGKKEPARLTVALEENNTQCCIRLEASLRVSLLQELTNGKEMNLGRRIVGGVAGCLLAIASSLAAAIGGSLEAEPEQEKLRNISFRLPVKTA